MMDEILFVENTLTHLSDGMKKVKLFHRFILLEIVFTFVGLFEFIILIFYNLRIDIHIEYFKMNESKHYFMKF